MLVHGRVLLKLNQYTVASPNQRCVSVALTMCFSPIVKESHIYCYNRVDSSLSLILHEPRFIGPFRFKTSIVKCFMTVKVTESRKHRAMSKGMN